MSYALIDVDGLILSSEDREVLQHPAVFGVILFSRNYHDKAQLKALTVDIKRTNPDLCVVVDQEGGRVQRFRDDFTPLPSMREWGKRYRENKQKALQEFQHTLNIMLSELKAVGVPVTLVPVLDLDYGVSDIIGERSFGLEAELVCALAGVMIETLTAHQMPATAKHYPGHGAVSLDSHEHLPVDSRPFADIWNQDLLPYRTLQHQLHAIMPAHIIYPEVDELPAGFSPIWLQEVLRKQLAFNGLVISDDLTMKATNCFGGYADRARLAKEAGCDVVTACNCRAGAIEVLDTLGDRQSADSMVRAQLFKRMIGQAH